MGDDMSRLRDYQWVDERIDLDMGGHISIEADYGDTPEVTLPIGSDVAGLTIDGEFVSLHRLPKRAREAYLRRYGKGQKHRVYQCDECGYLTMSKQAKPTAYNKYECNNSWRERQTLSSGTRRGRNAPEAWYLDLTLDGDTSCPADADPTRRLHVAELAAYEHDAERLDTAVVRLPDTDGAITGETNGKEWTATINYTVGDERLVRVAFERDMPNGETLTCTLKEYMRKVECGSTSFTKVYPGRHRTDDAMDIAAIDPDDVPNHKSHLGRIQSQVEASIRQSEMIRQVAIACREADRTFGDGAG